MVDAVVDAAVVGVEVDDSPAVVVVVDADKVFDVVVVAVTNGEVKDAVSNGAVVVAVVAVVVVVVVVKAESELCRVKC